MFDDLKQKVKSDLLRLRIRHMSRKGFQEQIVLGNCWDGVKRCLLCLPKDEFDTEIVKIICERLRDRFKNVKIVIIQLFDKNITLEGADYELITISPDDVSLLGLPNRSIRDRIVGLNVDMAIDLSTSYNPLTAFFCIISKAHTKISFAFPKSDSVFNLQIAPRQDRSELDRYRALAKYIG